MARQTRNQRRKARKEQRAEGSGVSQRARQRQAAVRPSAQPAKTQTGGRREVGGGFRRFVSESWGELKKVEWPNQRQVFQGTVVVIVACAIVGVYLWAADLVLKPLVQQILTGQ